MLVSTVRGFFRRIFRVEDLIEEMREKLIIDQKFATFGTFERPGAIAQVNVAFTSTDTEMDVVYPPQLRRGPEAGIAGTNVAVITPVLGDMGDATHAYIGDPPGPGDFGVYLDAAPGKSVVLSLLLVVVPDP